MKSDEEHEINNNSSKVVKAVNLTVHNTDLHRFPQPVNDLVMEASTLQSEFIYRKAVGEISLARLSTTKSTRLESCYVHVLIIPAVSAVRY
jgi:hypothetical protein